jgi:hypothetical protein
MRSCPLALTIAILLAIITLAGCSDQGASNANAANSSATSAENADTPKDNVDEFEMLVRLPFAPEEVVWKETALEPASLPDAPTKRLIAVLRFTPDSATRLSDQAGKAKPAARESLDTEPWYPAELIAQAGTSGEGKLAGNTYPADEFLQPPYTQGKLTRIDNTDYFILELFGR